MEKPAARLGDSTMHGSPLLGAACMSVLISELPLIRLAMHSHYEMNDPPSNGAAWEDSEWDVLRHDLVT